MRQSKLRQGFQWTRESFLLLKKRPSKWALLALTYVFFFMLLPVSPGLLVPFKLVIFISWSWFVAIAIGLFREFDFGRHTSLKELIQQIKPRLRTLILLSVVSIGYGLVISLITRGDTEHFYALTNAPEAIDMQKVLYELLPLMAKLLLLSAPIFMATWFAPPLIAFANYSLIHAMKSSMAGCLLHVIALSVAWLTITFFIMLGIMATSMLIALSGIASVALMQVLATLSLLVAIAWVLAFQYVTYRDIFDPVPTGGGEMAM